MSERRTRWIGHALLFGSLAVLVLGIAAFFVIHSLSNGPRLRAPTLPVPNGYDDLVRAGEATIGSEPADGRLAAADEGELAAFVDSNGMALGLLRRGLGHEIATPLQYTGGYLASHVSDYGPIRKAAHLLAAEGFLDLKRDRPGEAADRFLDLLRISRGLNRNGLLIDALIGIAIERLAFQGLFQARGRLSAADCRRVAAALLDFDRDREPFDAIRRRERDFALENGDWKLRLGYRVQHAALDRLMQPAEDGALFAIRANQARSRLLAVALALRAHRLDTKADARALADLVPKDLPAVPIDPFSPSGTPLRLNPGPPPQPYSIGPDGVDDGGTPLPGNRPHPDAKGDITADPS
ncbi:MAG TPA: hypothetical protein VG406_24595 [Isosphaeraceae bacterium]|jgi:hypothetical protein|nr:hypothetical protein [Isosphaeraceae bacterium]